MYLESFMQYTDITTVDQFCIFLNFRYHQKYYLQQHTWLCSILGFDEVDGPLLLESHSAARLNSFIVGFGSLPQIEQEALKIGLDEQTLDYVRRFFIKYQGQGITC